MLNRIQNTSEGTHRGGLNRHDYAQRESRDVAPRTMIPSDRILTSTGHMTQAATNISRQFSSPTNGYQNHDYNSYSSIVPQYQSEEKSFTLANQLSTKLEVTDRTEPKKESSQKLHNFLRHALQIRQPPPTLKKSEQFTRQVGFSLDKKRPSTITLDQSSAPPK